MLVKMRRKDKEKKKRKKGERKVDNGRDKC
jgi:hypothetical protein